MLPYASGSRPPSLHSLHSSTSSSDSLRAMTSGLGLGSEQSRSDRGLVGSSAFYGGCAAHGRQTIDLSGEGGNPLHEEAGAERKAFVFNPFGDEDIQPPPARHTDSRQNSPSRSTHVQHAPSTKRSSASLASSNPSHKNSLPSPGLVANFGSGASLADSPLPLDSDGDASGQPSAPLAEGLVSSASSSPARHFSSQSSTASKQPSIMSVRSGSGEAPVAGFRVPATGTPMMGSFPVPAICGPAFKDWNGHPIYVCSAIMGNSVHPGKAGPHLSPPVRICFAGNEVLHDGRYDILPVTSDMKWVTAAHGLCPEGWTPVQGGYEETGEHLHHALAKIDGFWVPGKAGEHLHGAHFPFGGTEIRLTEGYRLLCWIKIR